MAETTKNVTKASTKKLTTTKTSKEEAKSVVNLCIEDTYNIEEVEGRRLYINFGIDEEVIKSIVWHILRYNRQDRGKPIEDRVPIKLYINSPGGNVADGYGLIDAIITSKTPVWTINQAMCASMGFLIFIAGQKRYSMPHSEFLMHDGSNFAYDSTAKMKDRMDFELGELEQVNKDYIMSHTKIDENLYKEKYRVEWYFLPKLAKEVGVVDYIVGEDCDIDEIL